MINFSLCCIAIPTGGLGQSWKGSGEVWSKQAEILEKGKGNILSFLYSVGNPEERGHSKWNITKVVHKQRGKPGEMGKAVAIPPDKEAEKKEMFKVNFV